MKLNKTSQLMLAGAASLLVAGLLSACGTLTTDFVYVTSAKAAGTNNYGEIDIFEINSESGHMRQIPASPLPSGGRNPVAVVASPDYSSLFVVNQDDNTIVQFAIGVDGKLYPYNTINTPGIYPMAVTMNSTFLVVADTYQPLAKCTSYSPCSGSIAVFPLTSVTVTEANIPPFKLGTAITNTANSGQYWPLALSGTLASHVMVPTAVTLSGNYVFVSAYDSTASPHAGYIYAFAISSSGTLSAVSGSPFTAGTQPSALALDSTGKYLYATDYIGNNVRGYSVSNGALTELSSSPFVAGNAPSAIVINPSYNFAYVANATDSNVTAYSISNGALTRVATYASGSNPVAIGIDPSMHRFLYTVNFLGPNVSGWELNTTDGTLLISQGSPFTSNANPTAVAAVPHR